MDEQIAQEGFSFFHRLFSMTNVEKKVDLRFTNYVLPMK